MQERQSGLKSGGAQRGGAGNFGVFSPQKTYLYILGPLNPKKMLRYNSVSKRPETSTHIGYIS